MMKPVSALVADTTNCSAKSIIAFFCPHEKKIRSDGSKSFVDAGLFAPPSEFIYNLARHMIAFLSGKLLEKTANSVIVDVAGVGYEVLIPLSTFYEIGDVGSEIQLRIYTHVREDAIQLFGFKTNRERDLYLKLISVQGVGAKSGITMLSGMSADEIIDAIRKDNLAKLTAIPGVGRKTAERLVIELRDKVGELAMATAAGDTDISTAGSTGDDVFDDALSALLNLGYQRNAAEKAVQQVRRDGVEANVQKILRASLQKLAK
jgi:holliday junction DNA helicase RuvA